jgi:diaminopimelate decarboxylase
MPEMEQLNHLAGSMNHEADVALRVNPDVDAKTHEKISTGKKENKFGLPIGRIDEYVNQTQSAEHLNLNGLHFHIGSQITRVEPFERVIQKATDLIDDLRNRGVPIHTLNLGGGIGIRYKDEEPISPQEWAKVIVPEVESRDLRLIVEPGRFMMGNAGILATEVSYVKRSVTKNFVVVDAGMNDLIRPAMYDAYHDIVPIKTSGTDSITADVVGPVCETGDFMGKNRTIEEPTPGDHLAIMSCGAYGFAMSSQYNAFPRPAEVLVDGNDAQLIRERETYDELWNGEKT